MMDDFYMIDKKKNNNNDNEEDDDTNDTLQTNLTFREQQHLTEIILH